MSVLFILPFTFCACYCRAVGKMYELGWKIVCSFLSVPFLKWGMGVYPCEQKQRRTGEANAQNHTLPVRKEITMAVFRIEKNRNYTVMSNYHLRDMSISLKAKGLLSQMLSLPEGWDYTLSGLAHINREKKDAIREAVKELERAGYIIRSRERDAKGRLRGADYVIYELPQPAIQKPEQGFPVPVNPVSDKPTLENPT